MLAKRQATQKPIETIASTLPGTMQRSQVEALVVAVAPALGLDGRRVYSLLRMIQTTRPQDWTSPRHDPVCALRQIDLAAQLGKSSRAVRADERVFEALGLVRKVVGNDGTRGSTSGPDGQTLRFGLSFAPLIERVPDLLELRDLIERDERRLRNARRVASVMRRELRLLLDRLAAEVGPCPARTEIEAFAAALPRRFDHLATVEAVEDQSRTVEGAVHNALALLEKQSQTSGAPEADVRPLQDTTEEESVVCNGPAVHKWTAPKRADDKSLGSAPEGAKHCLENKRAALTAPVNTQLFARFKPGAIAAALSEEARFYLDAFRAGAPTIPDFLKVAAMRVPELGINETAWVDALDTLGAETAALAVLVIDANRVHPTTPVRNPGGLLRSMTARHHRGGLNIAGSLIGLLARAAKNDEGDTP